MRIVFLLLLIPSSAWGAERPNLVFLLADDLRADALGCTGHPLIRTPHLDQLAKRGVLFLNHCVTTSICAVSRASILSGQYSRRHGINDFATGFTTEGFSQTYPALLRQAGYFTGFIGKYGVGKEMPAKEFDWWRGQPGQAGSYLTKDRPRHLTAHMGDQALEFLARADGKQPFCLSVSFKAPHAQDGAPREFPPDPRDERLYEDVTFSVPRTAAEKYHQLLPEFARDLEGRKRWKKRFATPELFQKTARDYARLVTGLDREVGRIVAELEKRDLLKNTLIVFTSDNGFFLGERGMADKWLMYEEAIRVPLLIAAPKATDKQRGKRVEALTLNIDLAPTLLGYAGVKAPERMQGHSLKPLVSGEQPAWRSEWFYEHRTLPKIIPPSEGVRTTRWKYLRWTGAEPAVEELYDLKSDPFEENNLAREMKHQETLQTLRKRWQSLGKELR